jgi:prepilin-type N-terminal cleavage/methylation domain-containing protein
MNAVSIRGTRGFSLIELVIVVVIIGIIAAIAIPRMSRGATGAADNALIADLAMMRNAIDLFQTEHAGAFPDLVATPTQLTGYTNEAGTVGTKGDGVSIFGPYLREIPKLPVGTNKGSSTIAAATGAGVGWVYTKTTGVIIAGSPDGDVDAAGKKYNTY